MKFRIASHVLELRGEQMPGSFKPFVTDEPAQWRVLFGQKVEAAGKLVHEFALDDGYTRCRFMRDGASFCFTLGEDFGMRCDGTDTIRAGGNCKPGYLHFAVWMAFALFSLNVRAIPVHSSTVVLDGRAVMFLGESGTGKSTHTGLWLKHIPGTMLLNDDSPILSVESGTPMVFGSPWSGKTACYRNESYPLAAMVRLRQAAENNIIRLDTFEAFSALFPSCPPPFAKDSELTDKLIDVIGPVISSVPAFTLDCRPDEDAAQLSCRTIFGAES